MTCEQKKIKEFLHWFISRRKVGSMITCNYQMIDTEGSLMPMLSGLGFSMSWYPFGHESENNNISWEKDNNRSKVTFNCNTHGPNFVLGFVFFGGPYFASISRKSGDRKVEIGPWLVVEKKGKPWGKPCPHHPPQKLSPPQF